jgi:hypothetical protein
MLKPHTASPLPDYRISDLLQRADHTVARHARLQFHAASSGINSSRNLLVDGATAQAADLEPVRGVFADVFGAKLVRRSVEVLGEFLHVPQVDARGAFGVVPAHQFSGPLLPQWGHKELLVTRRYREATKSCNA